jgi:hypothetical protein
MLDTPADQAKINRLIDKYRPAGIVFDSLGTSTTDELNSETVVKKIYDYIDHVRVERDVFAWFIHHNRKAQATNKRPNKLSDIYGSQYITARATTVIGLWPVRGEIEVSGLKVRLAKEFDPFMIKRTDKLDFEIVTVGKGLAKSAANEEFVTRDDDEGDGQNGSSVFDF